MERQLGGQPRPGGRPATVLSPESQRVSGVDARSGTLGAAKAIAEAVRTTLGPKGMDKMLVDEIGEIVVTNDGATILREMNLDHPAADLFVDVAKSQEDAICDGTTTATVLAGALLQQAEGLMERDIHPTTLARGYRQAATEAIDALESAAIEVDPDDEELLAQLAATSMTGKVAENDGDHLAALLLEALQAVSDEEGFDPQTIKIEKLTGGSIGDSRVIDGLVLDREREHDDMPRVVTDATVAVVDQDVAVESPAADVTIDADDPEALDAFRDMEKKQVRERVRKFKRVGADVVIVGMNVDDEGLAAFAEEDIYALRRISTDDTHRIARATGANVVTHVDDLTEEDLGYAGRISEMDHRSDRKTIVDETPAAKSVTLFLRGGTFHVLDEVERAIRDALGVVETAIESGQIVPGGGAAEVEMAWAVRDVADSIGGREQLAMEEFAGSLEVLPRTLAENAGYDPIDSLVELRSRHADGETAAGLDTDSGEIVDVTATGVLEPLDLKVRAVESAMEAAATILRIDDIIAAGDDEDSESGPGGPGGAGGPPAGLGGPGTPFG